MRLRRLVLAACGLPLLVVAIHGVWVIATRLPVAQVDLAGHIASADAMWKGLFHLHDDSHFLGAIHGLFYPPLEDVLMGTVHLVVRDWVSAYQVYLVLLWLAYCGVGARLALRLAHPLASATLLLALAWFLGSRKLGMELQGLGLGDLVLIGLSSQVLGGLFLLLVLDELVTRETPRLSRLVLWASLGVLSHLVMGLVLALVFAVAWAVRRDRLVPVAGLWVTGLTACFWLPFVIHRATLTSASIIGMKPPLAILAVAVLLAVASWRAPRALPPLLAGLCMAAVLTAIHVIGPAPGRVPVFHYYRLEAPAVLLLLVGGAALVARPARWWLRGGAMAGCAVLLVLVVPRPGAVVSQPARVDLADLHWDPAAPYSRQLTIENDRPPDFGLDSLAAVTVPGYRAVKGLYWESSRANELLATYLAQLVGSPVVLSYLEPHEVSCLAQDCLFESFARDFNLGRLAIDAELGPGGMFPLVKRCYRQALAKGAIGHLGLEPVGSMSEGDRRYTIFRLEPRQGAVDTGAAQAVSVADLRPFARDVPYAIVPPWDDRFQACKRTARPSPHVFVVDRELAAAQAQLARASTSARQVRLTPEGGGRYRLDVDADADVAVWIKLSRLPGMRLVDEAGRTLPLLEAFPGMITVMHGTAWLEATRPVAAWVGYGISLVTLLAAVARALFKRRGSDRKFAITPPP